MIEKIKELYTKDLTFEEIETKLKEIINGIMRQIVDNKYNIRCIIDKELDENILAYTNSFSEVCLSTKIVEGIQNKDVLSFAIVLKHLEYIDQNYNIFFGRINPNIMQIIKEDIVLSSNDEWNCLKSAPIFTLKDSNVYTIQNAIAEYNAYKSLVHIFKKIAIEISKEDNNYITEKIEKNQNILLSNNFSSAVMVSDALVDFDLFFDNYIFDNPKWLHIFPQLNVEYYVDNNGCVCKRDKYDLIKIFESTNNEEEKKYITYLLKKISDGKKLLRS